MFIELFFIHIIDIIESNPYVDKLPENHEDFQLIWLDDPINESSDTRNYITPTKKGLKMRFFIFVKSWFSRTLIKNM